MEFDFCVDTLSLSVEVKSLPISCQHLNVLRIYKSFASD